MNDNQAIYILQQSLGKLVEAAKPFLKDMSPEELAKARKKLEKAL